MRILFFGSLKKHTYSRYAFDILKKNFEIVDCVNTDKFFMIKYISMFIFHIHPKLIEFYLNYIIRKKIKKNYDLFFVSKAELLGKKILKDLKKKNTKLIFLCFDNPFYNRDKSKWLLTLESINCYDLIVFQQSTRVKYAKKNNLNYKVIPPLFNKNIHKPLNPNLSNKKFRRDVIFLGTWFPERGKFAKRLIKLGLKFEIHGPQWNKDPEYKILSNYVVSKNGLYGIKYTKLISESKIVISLPNFHNDDDITMKSLEIPAIGSLLLTNNTKSHRELFENKKDAFFFKNADECVKICKFLLKNIQLIKKVSKNGYKKITRNSKFNFEKNLINSINAIM